MSKIGIILGRMQPFHNGHIWLIEQAFYECDEVYVFIGSADKLNERNPYPIADRINFVHNYFNIINSLVKIVPLDDLTNEDKVNVNWGNYLYKQITKNIKQDNFTLYTSENESFMKSWFSEDILNKIDIEYKHRSFGISATAIRLAIAEKDFDFVSKHVPKNVLDYLKESEKTK